MEGSRSLRHGSPASGPRAASLTVPAAHVHCRTLLPPRRLGLTLWRLILNLSRARKRKIFLQQYLPGPRVIPQ
jgi:hypothetical protein